jgi:hypothetical protein
MKSSMDALRAGLQEAAQSSEALAAAIDSMQSAAKQWQAQCAEMEERFRCNVFLLGQITHTRYG